MSDQQLMDLNIKIVKNKLDSYFGDKKEYVRDQRELEVQRGEMIRERIENNLKKLVVKVEGQLKK